jgi:hypothetical protein
MIHHADIVITTSLIRVISENECVGAIDLA